MELSDKELVTKTLRDCITGEIKLDATQVQSISILARASGMYTTKIEEVRAPRSSAEIRKELEESLRDLFEDKDGVYGFGRSIS